MSTHDASAADGTAPDSTAGATPATPARRRGNRRVVRRGTEREAVAGVSSDETATGWSDAATGGSGGAGDANDDRLRQDVPPHW